MSDIAAVLPLRGHGNARHASGTRALAGAIRYEFLMQARRRALWSAFALCGSVLLTVVIGGFANDLGRSTGPGGPSYTRPDLLVEWTVVCQYILIAGAGLLLADRTPRDCRTKTSEILWTTPAPTWARLFGKYTGAVVATLPPIFLIYVAGVARLALAWHDLSMLPLALATFAALVVPPLMFVGAFSIACTTLLWTPLYQFLFVGYWLWTSLNPGEAIPTLNSTLLSPGENYIVTGFFHYASYLPIDKGFYPASSVWLGLANMATLLGCGAVALLAAWAVQIRQTGGR
jgi:hypothetical protein